MNYYKFWIILEFLSKDTFYVWELLVDGFDPVYVATQTPSYSTTDIFFHEALAR